MTFYANFLLPFALGIMAIMFLLAIIQFVNNKQQAFAFYAFYIGCWFFYFLFDYFSASTLLGLKPPSFNLLVFSRVTFPLLSYVAYFQLANKFVAFNKNFKTIWKILKLLSSLILVYLVYVGFYCVYFLKADNPYNSFSFLYDVIRVIIVLTSIIIIFKTINKVTAASKFLLYGTLLLVIFNSIAFILSNPNLHNKLAATFLNQTIFIAPLFYVAIGVIIELICFLIGLNIRQKAIAKAKRKAEVALQLSVDKLANLEITQKLALAEERLRIASDMHDDVGAGLSRIKYISTALLHPTTNQAEALTKIQYLSDEAVDKMNEIIWALNQGNQNLDDLIYFIRSKCSEMVNNANLQFICDPPDNIPPKIVGWKNNRNIFLLVKEAVNNAIKYADATIINLNFTINQTLQITITDNGKGFNLNATRTGNGLNNLNKRATDLAATLKLHTAIGNGTKIQLNIPINHL